MIQLTFILKITTIQVVVMSVTVNNSPIQDYNHQHNCTPSTHEALLELGDGWVCMSLAILNMVFSCFEG